MTSTKNRLALGVATIALAGVFAFAPSYVPIPGSMDGAAFAKNGKGGGGGGNANKGGGGGKDKGNRGGGNSNKGGKSGSKSAKSDTKTKGKPSWAGGSKSQTQLASAESTEEIDELHPSQKGRWNASNANQAALDAHMRNGNYNGTIGALTQYQLAAKAAADYEGLSELEKSALDSFDLFTDVEISDQELADALNADAEAEDPVFGVTDGVVSCSDNCPSDPAEVADLVASAQIDAQNFIDAEQEAADAQAIEDFYNDSEQRIIEMSNKPTEGIEDQLLDDIAHDLEVERPDFEEASGGEEASNGGDSGEEELVLFAE